MLYNRDMKKTFTFFTALAFCALSLSSETIDFSKVCKNLSSHPNTRGYFLQTRTVPNSNRMLKSNGDFLFSLTGLMWKTKSPFPSTLILTRTSMTQINAHGEKTVIDTSNNKIFESMTTILSSVFSGDEKIIAKNFDITFACANNSWNAALSPKDKTVAQVLKKLSLSGKTLSSLDSIVMNDASGGATRYDFSNQSYPEELSNDEKTLFTEK